MNHPPLGSLQDHGMAGKAIDGQRQHADVHQRDGQAAECLGDSFAAQAVARLGDQQHRQHIAKAAAKAKAQECLDKINSGELSFEDAVEQYSEDTGSKEKKGDVGWDKLTTFVDSYQTALEGLNKGDVSDVVESTYGYHIIKCTDYFHVDNQVDDINQVPKAIKKYVSNVVKTQAASTAYSEWLEQYKKDADITVNPMPKDVPYNVSLKGVTKSSTDDSSTTE